MASGGGGAPGAVGGLGAISSPPPPRPRCAAPPRAVVASGAHGGGDLRGSLREVFERLFADEDLVSTASCVGASSPPPPPPPRCAATPPALVASHGHGGGDLRDSLREVFQWMVANGYMEFVAPTVSCVGTSSHPRSPRRAAPPPTLVASSAHGGGNLRDSFREVHEWLVANGYVDVALAATGVGARSSTPPPRCAAPPPAVVASDGHCGGNRRDPLRELFERLVAEGYVHLASPASGSPFGFCTINIGRFRASYLLNLNAQNSEAMLLINQKDMAEAYYPQRQSIFNHHHPRIHELNMDGTNFNAHEEVDDLSDALALFITKPKLFAKPSLLLSDIGLRSQKAHVYATTDVNSAIKEFDHVSSAQLIGSCTSAPQFCLTTDNMFGGSRFSFLHHEHGAKTDRWTAHKILTCRQCDTSAETIKNLLHLNSILQQKFEELSKHNIAAVQNTTISGHDTGPLKPELVRDSVRDLKDGKNVRDKSNKPTSGDNASQPDSVPNSDTESAGDYQEEKLMEKFNKMLVDCVFFVMPQVLIFFPKYQASEEKPEQRLSLMAIIQQTDNQSNEKALVVLFFVVFVSVWLLGLVLSLFGRGRRCTAAVSMLTLWTVGSTVAFIDYMLCKCLPEDSVFTWLFGGHCGAMFLGIAYIWFTYVRVPKFPSIQLPNCQGVFDRLRGWRQNPAPVGIAYIWFTYVRLPKFPSVQLPSCQGVFDRLRGWRQNPAPVIDDDAKAEDELAQLLLAV